jgi:hypothetical protein
MTAALHAEIDRLFADALRTLRVMPAPMSPEDAARNIVGA